MKNGSLAILTVLLLSGAVGSAHAADACKPATKYVHAEKRTPPGPAQLVVDLTNQEAVCAKEVAKAKKRHAELLATYTKCSADVERLLKMHPNMPADEVREVNERCAFPAYEEPICIRCDQSGTCKEMKKRAKMWIGCYREKIEEGENRCLSNEQIDVNIRTWCKTQITLAAAYNTISGDQVADKSGKVRPGGPRTPKAPGKR